MRTSIFDRRTRLQRNLEESVIRVRLQELKERITALETAQAASRLGPRVVRARLRHLNADREKLAAYMRHCGYKGVD